MSAHVPFGAPVFAATHARQVPLHELSQQTPSTHTPLAHIELVEHIAPSGVAGWQLPPVTQVSPAGHWALLVHAAHVLAEQRSEAQSLEPLQPAPSPHP